jgi:hypothetical protein
MRHPFQDIPASKRKRVFVPLLVLTLVVMGVLNGLGGPLKTEAAPQGIVSYEFAGNVSSAQEMLDSWKPQALAHAGFNLGFDFVFLLAYAAAIGLACAWVADVLQERRRLAALGLWLAWGQGLAALLDAVENTALLKMLLGSASSPWPQIAWSCALPKFALVFLGLVYVVVGVVLRVLDLKGFLKPLGSPPR